MTFQAQGFPARYGSGIAAAEFEQLGDYVLVTQPEPWALLADRITNRPQAVIEAGDLSPEHLDRLAAETPAVRIVGLGGGAAMDTAKWIHWRRSLPLVQFPSLPSVDACFTRMTALRDRGGVRYEGDAIPEVVIVDFDLFRAAPPAMVASGIGDILSCHTAGYDWQLAHASGRDEHGWTPAAREVSTAYLAELRACAPGVKAMTDDGLRRLMELHRDVGWRCHELGHARFEEGSEHFFVYCFEDVTGRTILHGDLVDVGVLLMSLFQGNDVEGVRSIIDAAGARHRPEDLGLTDDEIWLTLERTREFAIGQGLWWSQAHVLDLTGTTRTEVLDSLRW